MIRMEDVQSVRLFMIWNVDTPKGQRPKVTEHSPVDQWAKSVFLKQLKMKEFLKISMSV